MTLQININIKDYRTLKRRDVRKVKEAQTFI